MTILLTLRAKPEAVAMSVGLYITAAYWFTASTSFANPAVTLARGVFGYVCRHPVGRHWRIHCRADDRDVMRPRNVPLLRAAPAQARKPQRLRNEAMSITIYHNPACGTSRNTLAMIRASRRGAGM